MLEARWHNELYAVFEADLAERSELITAMPAENSEAADGQL
jgi:hypothetical protein